MNISQAFNQSSSPSAEEFWGVRITFTLIMALIALATSVSNIFVCVTLALIRPLRTGSNQLILNLCINGTLLGLIVMPYGAATTFLRVPVWGERGCRAIAYIKMVNILSSNLTMTLIGLDRYMKIRYTAFHRTRLTNMWVLIVGIWVISFLVSLPPLFGWGLYHWVPQKTICTVDWIYSISFTLFFFIFFVTIPLVIIIFCYGSIVRIVIRSRKRLDVHQSTSKPDNPPTQVRDFSESKSGVVSQQPTWARRTDGLRTLEVSVVEVPSSRSVARSEIHCAPKADKIKRTHHVNKAEIAVIRTLIIVVSTFVICWYPYLVCVLVKIATGKRLPFVVEAITIEIAFLGVSLDPIIYAVYNQQFRRHLRTAVQKQCDKMNRRL